jgi:hypothetical protein
LRFGPFRENEEDSLPFEGPKDLWSSVTVEMAMNRPV